MADIQKDNPSDGKQDEQPQKVLRAADIYPPYNKPDEQGPSKAYRQDLIPPLGGIKPAPVQQEQPIETNNDIPKFDLAEQIMSQHRKATSERRKMRTKETPAPQQQQPQIIPQPIQQQEQKTIKHTVKYDWDQVDNITKKIVARDISKMLGL
jgi:hypothetical protein